MISARRRNLPCSRAKCAQSVLHLIGLCCALFLALFSVGGPAVADEARPNRMQIEYVPPKNPAFQPIYDALKQHQALEKTAANLQPVSVPVDMTMKTTECGMSNAWYQRPTLTICYEYLADILKTLPKEGAPSGITPTDAMLGQFFYVVAHEMGHAMFDALNIPLFGRPEDAADGFAAYLMLHLGTEEDARRLIEGAAYTYKNDVEGPRSRLRSRRLPTCTVLRRNAFIIYCAWPTALTRNRSAILWTKDTSRKRGPRGAEPSMASSILRSSRRSNPISTRN